LHLVNRMKKIGKSVEVTKGMTAASILGAKLRTRIRQSVDGGRGIERNDEKRKWNSGGDNRSSTIGRQSDSGNRMASRSHFRRFGEKSWRRRRRASVWSENEDANRAGDKRPSIRHSILE
jgi:hypothetical protein